MRLRHVAALNPPVPGLTPADAGTEVSFLPLDRVWADGGLDLSETIEFDGNHGSYSPVLDGDVLLPKVSPTFAAGRVAVAHGLANGRALATSEVFVVRATDGEGARFLSYRLRARDFLSEGQASWTGVAGLKRISAEFVRNTRIDSAAWSRRGQIADFLDCECERIGRLASELTDYTRRLAGPALEEFRHLTQWIDHGRIGYRFEVQLGKMLDEKRVDPSDLSPYLRNANVHWDRLELGDVKCMTFSSGDRRKFGLRPGDVLVCEGGEPGRAAVWDGEIADCYYQKALHRLRAYGDDSPRFLLWCLRDLSARGAFGSDGPGRYTHLTAEQLRAVRIPLPPPSGQRRTAEAVDKRATNATRVSEEVEGLQLSLKEYRDALISEAVTGKVDIERLSGQQLDESARAAVDASRPETVST